MYHRLMGLGAVLALCLLAASTAGQDAHDMTKPKRKLTEEEALKYLKATDEFSKTVAGKDPYEYNRLFAGTVRRLRAQIAAKGTPHAGHLLEQKEGIVNPFAEARNKAIAKAARLASIFSDPNWTKNNEKLFKERMKPGSKMRIFGGEETTEGEYPDCVAVGTPGAFCCTGTLIGPNVVLTAGHCGDGGCAGRVYVGIDANHPDPKKIVKVKTVKVHEKYNPFTLENDLTLLILEKDVTEVTPRKIAATADVEASFFVRLVGFGFTEVGMFGVQNKVDVAIASASCDCDDCPDKYGCHKGKEMVAGGAGKDSCNGDSGGPAYISKDGEWQLAGATSRATRNSVQNCGDGGVYVRVDKYLDWIKTTAAANGGKLP